MLEKPSEEFIEEGADKVTPKDIETVVKKSDEIKKKFNAQGPLKRFVDDGKLLIALVKDWRSGTYRQVMYGTIAAVVFALIYVFDPFDIVPDFLPIIGAVDDATIIGACLMLIERDLNKYRNWRESQLLLEEGKQ